MQSKHETIAQWWTYFKPCTWARTRQISIRNRRDKQESRQAIQFREEVKWNYWRVEEVGSII